MFRLTRWTEPRGLRRLRQDMDDPFDRLFGRAGWPDYVTRSLRSFQRDLDSRFREFFDSGWFEMPAGQAGSFWPRVETALADGRYILRAEVPGFSPENVEVNVAGETLTIRGKLKAGDDDYRRFSYSHTLPEAVDPDEVKATLAHGILEIRMPASPKLVGKKIPIQAAERQAPQEVKAA